MFITTELKFVHILTSLFVKNIPEEVYQEMKYCTYDKDIYNVKITNYGCFKDVHSIKLAEKTFIT